MKITDLPGTGAEVTGLDLSGDVPDIWIAELQEAYRRRHLLVFRDQQLTPGRQVEVSGWFGPVRASDNGAVAYVSNVVPGGLVPEGSLPFHSDMSFTQTPLLGLSLFAIEVPGHGAQTLFADAAQAVGRLHPQTRVTLETGRILNIAGYGTNFSGRRRERDCDSREPRTEHPGIGPHPITGEPVLRVNQLSTAHVVGLAEGDSDDLLHEVFDVLYHPGNIYEHSWQVGDLVVFDNIAVHHARRDFDPAERRTLQRVVLSDRASLALSPDVAQLYAEAGTT